MTGAKAGRSTTRVSLYLSLGVIVVFILAALAAPWIAPYDPNFQLDLINLRNRPPGDGFVFGTDPFSRDVLSRVIYGSRVSLSIAGISTFITLLLGTCYGILAGLSRGWMASALLRFLDILMSIPRVLVIILAASLWPQIPVVTLVVILGFTGWFGLSRLVRAEVLRLRVEDYVLGARALGSSHVRIISMHIFPHLVPIIVTAAALGFGQVIVLEAGLSFLGLGVQPPAPSWGNIMHHGIANLTGLWWLTIIPGVCISLVAISFNTLGDILRHSRDPRSQSLT